MLYYIITTERSQENENTRIKPHICQIIEVVFEHDEVTADNIKELRKEAFKALYAQHPEAATVGHPILDKPWVEWIMSSLTEVNFT